MKITKIEKQKRNLDRVNIYINNKFAFGLTDELRYKYNLKTGTILTDNLIKEIENAENLNKAVNYSINLLTYRARSEKELKDRLIKKEYTNEQVEYALNFCKKHKYIDDLEFARAFTKDKIHLNNHAPKRIKYDLQKKGISNEIIEQVFLELEDKGFNEYDEAMKLAKDRIKRYKNDDRNSKYRKLSGYLQRRGYSNTIIYDVMNELLE